MRGLGTPNLGVRLAELGGQGPLDIGPEHSECLAAYRSRGSESSLECRRPLGQDAQ